MKNSNTTDFWDKKIQEERELLSRDPMTRDRIRTAYRFLPNKSQIVLDIGAGYGFIEEFLCKRKKTKIFGIDISNIAIKDLRKRFNGQFKKESIYNMKYKNNFFDAIFALEILEHIPENRIIKLLKSIRRFIKEDGALIISVPINESLDFKGNNPNSHMRKYTEEIIKEELLLANFSAVEVKKLVAFKNMYFLKKIISKIFKNRWKPNNLIIKAKPI